MFYMLPLQTLYILSITSYLDECKFELFISTPNYPLSPPTKALLTIICGEPSLIGTN